MPNPRATFSKKKVDTHQEEMMLAGMIMDDRFLREVRTFYKPELVESSYVRRIADWCINYYQRYEESPKGHIETLYHTALRKGLDDSESQAISKFIETLNAKAEQGQYNNFNTDHALDEVEHYLHLQSVKSLKEELEVSYQNEDPVSADETLATFNAPKRPTTGAVNPFTNKELIYKSFENIDPLYTFPGAMGSMLNEYLVRDAFVGIMGGEKMGKTWELIEHTMRATANMLNVAFFAIGDSNEEKMAMRKAIYISQKSNRSKYCGRLMIPVLDCEKNQNNTCKMSGRACKVGLVDEEGNLPEPGDEPPGYKPCSKCADREGFKGAIWYRIREPVDPLEPAEAYKYNTWWNRVRMKEREFKLHFSPSGTMNASDINSHLNIWCYLENWVPDVVIVDYADIMSAEPGCSGFTERDKQNANWEALRKLSHDWHCLVVTATQADANSYDQGLLLRQNFSEDKRKYGHSTVTIGLNQTPDEKDAGLKRRNIIMAREGDFNPYRTVTCLECLKIGRPVLDSLWTPGSSS